MSAPTPIFRDSDERDEAGWRLRTLSQAAETLAKVRSDTLLSGYHLRATGNDVPLLPLQNELDAARKTIDRVLACLHHSYDQRRRFDDPAVHVGPNVDLDDEPPF